ncbi:uncharacterized protein N0V89_007716 [Didymosphaeria variabile]|uniref:Sister chromatid cohesion protein Dcc1 n=1 Tax=Didymosphaeria variabile TaxID=1932322 RepID=A0A9W8XLP1_9PLEO|nr:uncharacterized protein N0V89_007716 [Didymosphaeria variabile]KAJ4352368.1 hypothetical protein N0V89_007716 [Didymosphaeria variabile]
MATQQGEGGVPFAVAHELQNFRLLELPPEIVELLEAPNPPPFQIRQVQTSNSVFVTQPAFDAHGNDIPTSTTCAIASCTATLELHPADTPAVAYIEAVLPVYDIVGGEVDAIQNDTSKGGVFADVPLSSGQCEQGWAEVVAFELSGSSYRPSVNTLRQVWSSINAAALAEGIRLDSQFLGYDLAEMVQEEGFPAPLALAIFSHLASAGQDTSGQWSCLDRRKTVSFVGKTLLQAKRGSSGHLVADFVEEWKDSLPEAWRGDAALKSIEGTYDTPTSTTIVAKGISASRATEAAVPKAAAVKGKWHERFAKTRK